jgi:hypothetical protein
MTMTNPAPAAMTEDEWRERMLNNIRTTATATKFIAIVIALGVLFSIIGGIIIGVQIAKVAGNPATTCQSQGGDVANCEQTLAMAIRMRRLTVSLIPTEKRNNEHPDQRPGQADPRHGFLDECGADGEEPSIPDRPPG